MLLFERVLLTGGRVEEVHGLPAGVGASDQPLVSLKVGVVSRFGSVLQSGGACCVSVQFGVLRSISALWLARVVVLQLSRLLRSIVGLDGPDEWRSSRGVRTASCGSAGFERLLAREDVRGGDQHFARDRGLGRVGLAVAGLGVGVEPVPRVGRAPCLLSVFDRLPAQGVGAGFGDTTGPRALPRLRDRWGQPGVADELLGCREP
jgi:hypothetical protein